MSGFILAAFLLIMYQTLPLVQSQDPCPFPPNPPRRTSATNCTECFPGYDMSSDCSTCVGAESIQCVEGQQNCSVGTFTFSALFHSYNNPNNMCGECGQPGNTPTTCQDGVNSANCSLRHLYCLRPYGSPPSDVPLLPQAPLTSTDSFTFEEGFIALGDQDNFFNRLNPFTRELQLWPGRAQFYIVVYSFFPGTTVARVVDRFLIDLELSVSSGPIARTIYSGIHDVSQFDLSFSIDGQCSENYHGPRPQCNVFCVEVPGQFTCNNDGTKMCVNVNLSPESNCTKCAENYHGPQCNVFCSGVPRQFTCDNNGNIQCVNSNFSPESNCTQCAENYYGPQCNVFCSGVPGQFTCDSNGNIECVNNILSPESNCTQCREPGEDPEDNCGDTSGSSASSRGALVGGIVGGVLGGVILLVIAALVGILCYARRKSATDASGRQDASGQQDASDQEDTAGQQDAIDQQDETRDSETENRCVVSVSESK